MAVADPIPVTFWEMLALATAETLVSGECTVAFDHAAESRAIILTADGWKPLVREPQGGLTR